MTRKCLSNFGGHIKTQSKMNAGVVLTFSSLCNQGPQDDGCYPHSGKTYRLQVILSENTHKDMLEGTSPV